MNNCNRGGPLKIKPTNNKTKGEGETPTKEAATSTAETKKHPVTKTPPTTMSLPIYVGSKYTNSKQDHAKYALTSVFEVKLKLDSQLAAGDIIISDGTLQDHVRYYKDEVKKRRVSSIIYLKYFT